MHDLMVHVRGGVAVDVVVGMMVVGVVSVGS